MRERRGVYRVWVEKLEGKSPLKRPRRRWEDNIKMDLQEVGCGSTDWIELVQDKDRWRARVNAVMNLRV
jgi:ribosome biogenesis protein Nip4